MFRFLFVTTCALSASHAMADLHHDLDDITGWYHLTNAPTSDVDDLIEDDFRIIDIEIEAPSPWTFGSAMVRNSGNYESEWWWYYGKTRDEINAKLKTNNARLIDIEPHINADNQIRYGAVAKLNTGPDAIADTDWMTNMTQPQVQAWINANPDRRIHDIQPYETTTGLTRYAFTWIGNTGSEYTDNWVILNTTIGTITKTLEKNNARLVDIERNPNGQWSVIMVPSEGTAWWWFYNISPNDCAEMAGKFGGRVVDFERYETVFGDRSAIIVQRNATDLAIKANAELRADLEITADSGLLLKTLGGSNQAWINGDRQFEPASLLKTFHHFHALRQVNVGNDDLGNSLIFPYSQNQPESCPDPNDPPAFANLQQALRDMMTNSNNSATEAIRSRYGSNTIQTTASVFGAFRTELNHIIGCFCSTSEWNLTTLEDVAVIHNRVRIGTIGEMRDTFYDLMQDNYLSFDDILSQELAASSLDPTEKTQFQAHARAVGKGGSYNCSIGNIDRVYRSRGSYLKVPYRVKCKVIEEEYFAGVWINDDNHPNGGSTGTTNANAAMSVLFRDRIRDAIASWESSPCAKCDGDFNNDGTVDGSDMGLLLAQWGACPGDCPFDLNGDGIVDGADFGLFLAFWGPCP